MAKLASDEQLSFLKKNYTNVRNIFITLNLNKKTVFIITALLDVNEKKNEII